MHRYLHIQWKRFTVFVMEGDPPSSGSGLAHMYAKMSTQVIGVNSDTEIEDPSLREQKYRQALFLVEFMFILQVCLMCCKLVNYVYHVLHFGLTKYFEFDVTFISTQEYCILKILVSTQHDYGGIVGGRHSHFKDLVTLS